MARANLCVGDAKRPVEAYKCFKFAPGTVSSHNGYQGIVTSSPLDIECLVYAERFYDYLRAHDAEELEVKLDAGVLKVGGAKFPVLFGEDFPEVLADDLEDLGTANVNEAVKAVRFCAGSPRVGIPASVRIKGYHAYASDTRRVARFLLNAPLSADVCLPIDACKVLERMGHPTTLVANDNSFGAFYEETETFFVCRQIEAPDFSGVVDRMLGPFPQEPYSVPDLVDVLKRVGMVASEDTIDVRYSPKTKSLLIEGVAKDSGSSVQEDVPWDCYREKPFRFKVSLAHLLDALRQKPDTFYVHENCLQFSSEHLDQAVALQGD